MQGKSCFNFAKVDEPLVDEPLLAELEALTGYGATRRRRAGSAWRRRRAGGGSGSGSGPSDAATALDRQGDPRPRRRFDETGPRPTQLVLDR